MPYIHISVTISLCFLVGIIGSLEKEENNFPQHLAEIFRVGCLEQLLASGNFLTFLLITLYFQNRYEYHELNRTEERFTSVHIGNSSYCPTVWFLRFSLKALWTFKELVCHFVKRFWINEVYLITLLKYLLIVDSFLNEVSVLDGLQILTNYLLCV